MSKLIGTGGGSKKQVNTPVRYGQPAKVVSPGGADQLGQAMGAKRVGGRITNENSASPLYQGNLAGPGSQKLGNELAGNVGKGGPGAGRTVMARGTQSHHQSQPMPKGHDILNDYGPNMRGRK